ncbi:polysaccharide deacetylase family protein, partial [Streptomyces sp. SID2131]|nr:polysaccharide deacetylase family protein [Streptomyces sp. SID2131]
MLSDGRPVSLSCADPHPYEPLVMKKDQMPSGRRAVLRLAAALGATATVGVLAA